MCIQNHDKFDGFYVTDSVEESGGSWIICCRKTGVESTYVEDTYVIDIHNERIRLRSKQRHEDSSRAEGPLPAIICVLPPLTFRARTSIFNIDKIDTIAQSFQTDFYCELRLINIIDREDEEAINTLLSQYQLHAGLIDFLNVSEVIGEKEVWNQFNAIKSEENCKYTYCIKMRMKAVFNEQMEVHAFPFDIQPMTIGLTFNGCTSRVALEVNNYYPSIFFAKQFQSSAVYDVVYDDLVLTEVRDSNPSESSAGYVYPRCSFSTYFARRPMYYMSNVVMPMTLLTLLGPLSNSIEADGALMGTADRLGVSLTLLLTAVAYKFIVATSLPQVSYLTALDVQVLLCFAFLVLSAIENCVYPYLSARFDVDRSFEVHFVICYYGAFLLSHLVLFTRLGVWLLHRRRFFDTDLVVRRVMKAAYVQILKSGRAHPTDYDMEEFVLAQVLANKGLQRSVALDHPKHQYALTGLKSKHNKKKVGVAAYGQSEQQALAGLVSLAETETAFAVYSRKLQEECEEEQLPPASMISMT
jgi:hypothetical protein